MSLEIDSELARMMDLGTTPAQPVEQARAEPAQAHREAHQDVVGDQVVTPSSDDASIDLMRSGRPARLPADVPELPDPDAGEVQAEPGAGGLPLGALARLVSGVIVLAAAGYLAMPVSSPATTTVKTLASGPVARAPVPAAADPAMPLPTPGAIPVGGAAGTPVPAAPLRIQAIDLAAMGDSPQSAAEVASEIELDGLVLAASEQTCGSRFVQGESRSVCQTQGPVRYFKCTRGGGRVWDAALPGCEIL